MKKRQTFECWNCERTYTQLVEGQPKLIVECPFCGAEAEVDLAPWREQSMTIMRGGGEEAELGQVLNLPDVLPTTKRTGL